MNNGNPEIAQPDRPAVPGRISRSAGNGDELSRLKHGQP
jgi:hypothetical protein